MSISACRRLKWLKMFSYFLVESTVSVPLKHPIREGELEIAGNV